MRVGKDKPFLLALARPRQFSVPDGKTSRRVLFGFYVYVSGVNGAKKESNERHIRVPENKSNIEKRTETQYWKNMH